MSDATPLTPEEEAALRGGVTERRDHPWDGDAIVARLLATLDAARAASQGDEGLDVERLREAAQAVVEHAAGKHTNHDPYCLSSQHVEALRAALAAEEERRG